MNEQNYQHEAPDDRIWRFLDRAITRLANRSLRAGTGRVPAPAVERGASVRITRVDQAAEGVRSFELTSAAGVALPAWQPGAHVDVQLPSGRRRQYSLCGDPADHQRYRIAVRLIRDGRGGSAELHELREGTSLRVSSPRHAFPFIDAPRYAFIAGGIGITPILPMLRAARERGADFWCVYTGRSRASMPFLRELAELANASPGAGLARVLVLTDDEHGTPSAERLLELMPAPAPLYCCGPSGLIDALRTLTPSPRVSSLHYERFTPAPVIAGEPFEIVLARSGTEILVAADETALSAVQRALPHVAYSCRQGFCGTCRVRVLEGDVEHHDSALSPAERRELMTLCVSRARRRVVVDL